MPLHDGEDGYKRHPEKPDAVRDSGQESHLHGEHCVCIGGLETEV